MNKIEPLAKTELLAEGRAAEMESLFLSETYRAASGIYVLSFGVDEPTWLTFKASVPRGAIVMHRFYWTNGDDPERDSKAVAEPKQKEPKEAKGPHSAYWQEMFRRGFNHHFGLMEALGASDAASVRDRMHFVFAVDTLAQLEPMKFEEFAADHDLESLVTMSHLVRVELQEGA